MLGWIKKQAFKRGLADTGFYRSVVRRLAYSLADGDPEKVHELALEALTDFERVLAKASPQFDFPDLRVQIAGKEVMPFGTAAGLDKNGDALLPLSHIFGFLEPGTVVVSERKGNDRPRVAVDTVNEDIYNAQGFPSKGLEYFLSRARHYQEKGGKAPLLISVCGLPPIPEKIETAFDELELLVDTLCPYASGFVWNPFSPNTSALKALRTPKVFRRSAELVARKAPGKLKLVKMGPFDGDEEQSSYWLGLVDAWLEGGADGIVAVNTYAVPNNQVPSKSWGYPSAGRSGRFLQDYRQRAIADARRTFPSAVIIATGGIDSGQQAWNAFEAGADALEGYTPYTFHGFGLLREMALHIREQLARHGCKTLSEYLAHRDGSD